MAYRFNGTTNKVTFSSAPFNGTTIGPLTFAIYLKRTTLGAHQDLVGFYDSAGTTERSLLWCRDTGVPSLFQGASCDTASAYLTSSSVWYIVVVTVAAGTSSVPRFHIYNGTSWVHVGTGNVTSVNPTIGATDIIRVSSGNFGGLFAGDIVCVAAKKANPTDLQVETLSPTAFSAWAAFGFDWLIGFDTSLTSGGVLQDQASPGTGDEVSKVGTSVVADPPGWSWAAAPAAPKSGFLAFT